MVQFVQSEKKLKFILYTCRNIKKHMVDFNVHIACSCFLLNILSKQILECLKKSF